MLMNDGKQWMGNTQKKGGLTRHARCARKIQGVRQGKWTSLEDMFMLLVWRKPVLETFLPDCSPDEHEDKEEEERPMIMK